LPCGSCFKRDATIHVTSVEGGKARELHLCEDCAQGRGIELPSPPDLELGALRPGEKFRSEEYAKEAQGGPCSSCGHFNTADWNFCSACGSMRQP
jgi:protein-arginine kinase activator protein McsA